jgi:hypothetical protein
MISIIRPYLFGLLIFYVPLICLAQDYFDTGMMPGAKIKFENLRKWEYTLATESRLIIDYGLIHSRTDLSFFAGKGIRNGNKISAGYSYLNKLQSNAHRIIQQYSLYCSNERSILSFRIASDQTFEQPATTLRFRKRIALKIPFRNLSVDQTQWYLKSGGEYLSSISQGNHQVELRFTPMLGYKISEKNKAEFGIDYRIQVLILAQNEQNLWFKVIYYMNI